LKAVVSNILISFFRYRWWRRWWWWKTKRWKRQERWGREEVKTRN